MARAWSGGIGPTRPGRFMSMLHRDHELRATILAALFVAAAFFAAAGAVWMVLG